MVVNNSQKIVCQFLDQTNQPLTTIQNWTSVNIQQDFFTPANTFTLVLEDDRAYQLIKELQLGIAVQMNIQLADGSQYPVMTGYNMKYNMTGTRAGGQKLTIMGKDLLGWMEHSVILPSAFQTTKTITQTVVKDTYQEQIAGTGPNPSENFGNDLNTLPAISGWGENATYSGTINPAVFDLRKTFPSLSNKTYTSTTSTTQVKCSLFNENTTFAQAFQYIFNAFTASVNLPYAINLVVDDSAYLKVSTGGLVGIGTGNKGTTKAIQNKIGHLLKPNNNETYLAYALRLAKHLGCNIKLAPFQDTDPNGNYVQTVFISPPTYDRTNAPLYSLIHKFDNPDSTNNILEYNYSFDLESQPSVIIMECAGNGNGSYYQSSHKAIAVNELTGFQRQFGSYLTYNDNNYPLLFVPNVLAAINSLTQSNNGENSTGYTLIPSNVTLYNSIPATVMGLQTQTCIAHYMQDNNAHNLQELLFGCAKAMAEAQDNYLVISYLVDGWTYLHPDGTEVIWAPNMMVTVYDEGLSQTNPLNLLMWIKKVNFTQDRHGGTHTYLELTLPYTHSFDRIPQAPTNQPGASSVTDTYFEQLGGG
jgi:hypothetical protein